MMSRRRSEADRFDILRLPPSLERDGWRDLILEWGGLLDEWQRHATEGASVDVAFWYGERALTGLLTAAIWRLGGVGLEETCGYRGSGKKQQPGRADALLGLPLGRWYSIEAKQWYPGDLRDLLPGTRNLIGEAEDQLNQLPDEDAGDLGLALCYIVPDVIQEPAGVPYVMSACASQLQSQLDGPWLLASYSPLGSTSPRYQHRDRKACCPGMLVVGRVVDGWE